MGVPFTAIWVNHGYTAKREMSEEIRVSPMIFPTWNAIGGGGVEILLVGRYSEKRYCRYGNSLFHFINYEYNLSILLLVHWSNFFVLFVYRNTYKIGSTINTNVIILHISFLFFCSFITFIFLTIILSILSITLYIALIPHDKFAVSS